MKLKDLFEGDVVSFPGRQKSTLDTLLKQSSVGRVTINKLMDFIMDDKNPMSLRIKALIHLHSGTGSTQKYTAEDVVEFTRFGKETDEMIADMDINK